MNNVNEKQHGPVSYAGSSVRRGLFARALQQDTADMGWDYRRWVFAVQSELIHAGARPAAKAFCASLRPGPWGSWAVWCGGDLRK